MNSFVRRQLFFPVSDNYFSLSTTITLEVARSAAAAMAGASPPSQPFFGFRVLRGEAGVVVAKRSGKVGNLPLVFHFPRPLRPSCGNVGISPPFGEISKGLVERVGKPAFGFPRFPQPRHFHSSSGPGFSLRRPIFIPAPLDPRPAVSFWLPLPDSSEYSAR